VETDVGEIGWCEATVVPNWSGETQGGALALILDYFADTLIGRDPLDLEWIVRDMDAEIGNPFTKAAVSMAVL
jgi:hypothetical protein